MHKRKKRAVTLVEIMIVIMLIGLIGGALAYNMRGSMEKGRVFKTEQNILRVQDALMMALASGEKTGPELELMTEDVMKKCVFVKDGANLLKDGWGIALAIKFNTTSNEFDVTSAKLEEWKKAHAL